MCLRISQNNSYSFCEKIVRTCVLQLGVYKGFIEKLLMRIYMMFTQKKLFPKIFDERQAEKALEALKNLGAEVQFVIPRDGRASIQMMTMRAAALEKKLNRLGAKWEKLPSSSGSILAIIPPPQPTQEWQAFEKDLLTLKWNKRTVDLPDGGRRDVIVTCGHADAVPESHYNSNLFLHTNSPGVSFIMLKRRIGFCLGCKQDICLYDPRGTWKSTGIASEGGYYNDVEAVYDRVKDGYNPKKIWISGTCGGMSAAAYLKSRLHGTGVNLILENGSTNVKRDWVDPKPCLVRRFARRYWSGMASKDIPVSHKPKETGFNIEELWNDLGMSDLGKVMVVSVTNDQMISAQAAESSLQLAQRVNRYVLPLFYQSPKENAHTSFYFENAEAAGRALSYIYGP